MQYVFAITYNDAIKILFFKLKGTLITFSLNKYNLQAFHMYL